jgi:hypothetical protein
MPCSQPSFFAILSAQQPSTQNVPQLPSSLTETFNLVSSGSARVQREIPQDFFAPAYLESSMQNMEVQHTNKDASDLGGENLFV